MSAELLIKGIAESETVMKLEERILTLFCWMKNQNIVWSVIGMSCNASSRNRERAFRRIEERFLPCRNKRLCLNHSFEQFASSEERALEHLAFKLARQAYLESYFFQGWSDLQLF